MPYDMKTLALDTTAATSATILFGAINGQTDTQPIPIPINIVGTYVQANFGATFANPTGTVGLAAVNGAATTAMRSDAAPALSQAIAPTWTGQHIFNNAVTQLGSTSQLQWSTDLILTRFAAAALQLGAADAAAPVPQTLQPQSVVTGTSNTAGATFIIGGSKSTGNAAGGALQMAVALAGGAGSTQNALTNIWNIAGTGHTLWNTDNTYDLGASGATRPRSLYLGTNLNMASGGLVQWNADTILSRANAASLQLGGADAASPVAQTFGVQNVVTGTSNTAGANWTFIGSKSTGNAGGGSIIFQIAPAGGSGSSQNPGQTILTMLQSGVIQLNAAGSNAALASQSNVLYLLGSGATSASGGSNYIRSSDNNPLILGTSNTDRIQVPSAGGGLILGPADGASPTAQTLSVQNVAAGNSNVNGANWTLNGSLSTGTGTSGDIIFQTGGTGAGATSQNAEVTALTIKGATQQVVLATNLRINVTPTANTSASTTITNGADSSTNLGHRLSFNFNGTTYWIPCGSTAF